MLSQYPQSAFQGSVGITRRGQQQFATQTLRVHLLGIEMYVQLHMDWTEHLRDRWDISAGQPGHVHRMVAVQKWGCAAEFLYV